MTRTKPAEERRADLLAASEELFLEKGVGGTSLDDITSRAGVSKGLFYLYFRSKDDLLAALQDQFSVKLADRIRTASDEAGDWPAKLDACVQTIFDSYRENSDLHVVLFQHAGHVSASHRKTHDLVRNAIADLLAGGNAAGAFDVPDPAATAVLCWASTHGFDPDLDGEPPGGERDQHGVTGQPSEHAPDDSRIIAAAKQLFRRAAGVTTGPE